MAQSTNTKKKSTAKKTTKSTKKKAAEAPEKKPMHREVFGIVLAVIGVLTLIGYFSDDAFLVSGVCKLVKGLIGFGYWVFPPMLLIAAWGLLLHRDRPAVWRTTAALLLPLLFGAFIDIFAHIDLAKTDSIFSALYEGGTELKCGGVISGLLSYGLCSAITSVATGILLVLLIVFCALSSVNVKLKTVIGWFKDRERPESDDDDEEEPPQPKKKKAKKVENEPPKKEEPPKEEKLKRRRSAIDIPLDDDFPEPEREKPAEKTSVFGSKIPDEKKADVKHTKNIKPLSIEEAEEIAGVSSAVTLSGSGKTEAAEISDPPKKISKADVAAETAAIAGEIAAQKTDGEYEKPPIYLLKKGHAISANSEEELRLNKERLTKTINSFGVNAKIVGCTRGPTVTRFDLALEQGVKLNRLTNLSEDIALSLGVVSVRVAPIPDKISTVGIEVPNKVVSTVYLRDIIDSPKFASSKSLLSFAVGKDIGGEPVVGNISKLPHLLIAGTTGSGKSVCMNSLIISLLYKADPDEVKLIMIDPKMVELGVYNGIPHLYIPVVTDPKKAAGALQWAVTEMLKRYRLFSEVGVRNLAAYNTYLEENGQSKMPSIVVVIDELADLMLVASKDVEESICRVAQMGRAAGVHLIIATQRPSADVITGLMKANIPSRIAFAVSSALESRIILDNAGAEKLVGMGDMLYAPIGCGKPQRIQGAFVSDEERDQIVSFIKEKAEAQYSEDVMAQIEKAAEDKNQSGKKSDHDDADIGSEYDELLPQAVDVIFDTKQASVSMLQRRLKLGYSRAARIVDQMEEIGVIGPFEGSKPRQILITREQWLEMQTVTGTAPTEMLKTSLEFADENDDDE